MSEEQTRFFGLKRECGLHEEGGKEHGEQCGSGI
jgi:phosphoadenosine phosphosulfate reductase